MRKTLAVLGGVVVSSLVMVTPAGAQDDYDYSQESPYMHYAGDESGTSSPFEAELSNLDEDEEYKFALEEIDKEGNFEREITRWSIDGETEETIEHDFGSIDNEGFPYRLRDRESGDTIMKGFTAETPDEDFRDEGDNRGSFEAVGIGDVVYNEGAGDGYLHDFAKPNTSIVEQGDYVIMHYRFPVSFDDGDGHTIQLYSENDDDTTAEFNAVDIIDGFQGTDSPEARRSFVILNTDGDTLDFVDDRAYESDTWSDSDNPFNMSLSRGVYSYSSDDEEGSETAKGESFLGVGNEETEWELEPSRDSVREGYNMTWTITRNTEQINDVFGDHTLVDGFNQEDYGGDLSDYQSETTIKYRLDSSAETDETYETFWQIRPEEDFENGADKGDYEGELKEEIKVRGFQDIQDNLDDLLDSIGLGDQAGEILFSVVTMVGVAFALAFYNAGFIVITIAMFGLVAVFTVVGFIPLWFIMTIMMLGVSGVLMTFKGSGGD